MNSEVTTHAVRSRDGTSIGFLRQGMGPCVVLVQGAMADVHAYRALAQAVSPGCTVISAERRGRGLSPRPYSQGHDIARDIEDIDAVMGATGATSLFGLSSGAVIALEAARTLKRVERLAVYEPPFYPSGISRAGIQRLNDEIERGAYGAALIDALTTAGTAPAVLERLPRPLARLLARMVLVVQAQRPGPASSLRDLLPGVRYDFGVVAQVDGRMATFRDIDVPTLVLSGSASPTFLRDAATSLSQVVRGSRLVELDGLGHDGPWNSGDPEAVAAVLAPFFVAQD